jgi:polyhydroxybutyrate depolymerase
VPRIVSSDSIRRPVFALVGALVSIALLGSCSGSSDSGSPSITDGPTTVDAGAPPAPTCAPARAAKAPTGTEVVTLTSGAETRQYLLSVPPTYDGQTGAPLILDFHDTGFTSVQHASYTLLPQKGSAVGYIVATLQASPTVAGWQLSPGGAVDDFQFTHDVVAQLEATLCIDPARLYAVGYGVGALFTSLLACQSPDPIAAIGLVAGELGPSCPPSAPVSVMGLHGTADAIVPYGGQQLGGEGDTATLPGAEQALANWAAHNGCAPTPVTETIGSRVRHLSWLDCTAGAAVTLYSIEDGGHTWPGGTPLATGVAGALGAVSTEVVGTDLLLAFFALHPGPPA